MDIFKFTKKIYYLTLARKRQIHLNKLIRNGLKLGKDVDIVEEFLFDPAHCNLISIGDNCTICPNVRLIAHDASTKKFLGCTKIGLIDIKDNCFIGDSCIILPDVKIGPNSIVGAGSVVTNDVPPCSIAAGNPARVISTLDEYIEKIKNRIEISKIFDASYHVDRIDEKRSKELLAYLASKIGFIE